MRPLTLIFTLVLAAQPAMAQEGQGFSTGKSFANEHKGGVSSGQMDSLPDTQGDASQQKSLFQGGKGDAAGPGLGRVSQCAPTEGDPECDAINLMNQGEAQSSGDYNLSGSDEKMVADADEIKDNAESIVGPNTTSEPACVQTTVETPENVTKQRCEVFREANQEECRVERSITVERRVAYECEDGYSQDLYSCTKKYEYDWRDGIGLDIGWKRKIPDLPATGTYQCPTKSAVLAGVDDNGNLIIQATEGEHYFCGTASESFEVILDHDTGGVIKSQKTSSHSIFFGGATNGIFSRHMFVRVGYGAIFWKGSRTLYRKHPDDGVIWEANLRWTPEKVLNSLYHSETNSIIVAAKSGGYSGPRVYLQSFNADTGETRWIRTIRYVSGYAGHFGYSQADVLASNGNIFETVYYFNNSGSYVQNRVDLRTGAVVLNRGVSNDFYNRYRWGNPGPGTVFYTGGKFYYEVGRSPENSSLYALMQYRKSDHARTAVYTPPAGTCTGWGATYPCNSISSVLATDFGDVFIVTNDPADSQGSSIIRRLTNRGELIDKGWSDGCAGLE